MRRRHRLVPWLYLTPALLLVGVFVYYPVIDNFRLSLYAWSAFSPRPTWVGVSNYQKLMGDPVFWSSLLNNTYYAIVSVAFQVGLGLVIAAVLEETLVRRLRVFFRTVYFIPAVVSITVVGLLFQTLYDPKMGLIDQFLVTIGRGSWTHAWLGEAGTAIWSIIAMSQWQYTGYITLLFVVAIQKIPHELYESAAIDGASRFRAFVHVTVPLVREMTLLALIITISGAYMVFNEVMVTTQGGPDNASHVLSTWLYQSAFLNDQMGYASTIAAVIFVVTFTLAVIQLTLARSGRDEASAT
ncbi:MAG TPA: sugar ABC transporter permease [bacterium]|nr:sugar ABC transporter permease [bacterium]